MEVRELLAKSFRIDNAVLNQYQRINTMKRIPIIFLFVLSITVSGFAFVETEGEKLKKLFADSNEDNLRRNPILALFRGDTRYASRFGDFITDKYFDGERKAAQNELKRLLEIDRSKLSPTDKIAYDVFKYNTEETLEGLTPELMALSVVRPINHFSGFHTFYPTFASGQGGAPFNNMKDYENNLKRHKEFATLIDRSIGRFKQGMKSGVVETKLTIRNVIEQLDTQLAMGTEKSPFMGPTKKFPEAFKPEDKARLRAQYKATLITQIFPAYKRLRDFLKDEYLEVAREGVGLKYMKGGDRAYQELVEGTTTLKLKPDYIHKLGLSEVKRIRKRWRQSRRK